MVFGPNFGYHPNGNKTWLVVSESLKDVATEVFEGTSVQVTTQGRKHLGAALGSRPFVEQCVTTGQRMDSRVGTTVNHCPQSPPGGILCL